MEKIIGGKPEEIEKAKEELKNDFEKEYSEIQPYELESTPEQEKIIELVQEAVMELAKKYGAPINKLPRNKIHIARKGSIEEITKGKIRKGMHDTYSQDVVVEWSGSRLIFARGIAHELLHGVGKQIFQISGDGSPVPYQTSSSFFDKPNADVHYLADLDEAVIEELGYKIVESLKHDSLFADEYRVSARFQDLLRESLMERDLTREEKDLKIKQLNELLGLPHWELVEEKLNEGASVGYVVGYIEGMVGGDISSLMKSRMEERQKLESLIEEISAKHPKKISKEEVFEMFAKFHFGGKSPIGKIIEEALGKGSFIRIAQEFSKKIR